MLNTKAMLISRVYCLMLINYLKDPTCYQPQICCFPATLNPKPVRSIAWVQTRGYHRYPLDSCQPQRHAGVYVVPTLQHADIPYYHTS